MADGKPEGPLGVSILHTENWKSQELVFELWNTKYHEVRMLAVLLMNPKVTTDAAALC